MQTISVTQLTIGQIARAHGARFEIVSTRESRGHIDGYCAYGRFEEFVGPSPVAYAIGRFIDGEPQPGYFGPGKDWSFQGNANARVRVEH